jgi:hypothetical protein
MNTILGARLLGFGALLALATGCVTSKVWEDNQFARFHEPAAQPNLALYYSSNRQDVLVCYSECRDDGKACQRAFWLELNDTHRNQQRKPRFVTMPAVTKLTPIPIYPSGATNAPLTPSDLGLYAIAGANSRSFMIYDGPRSATGTGGSKALWEEDLPTWRDASGRIKQVALTPLAVVADVSIVGAVVAYVSAPSLWVGMNGWGH